ncbi:MAG: nitroreductase family protein [Bacteroidales bacterium]|nr:nitroreductase family protein [Bacteroidales bacterium]
MKGKNILIVVLIIVLGAGNLLHFIGNQSNNQDNIVEMKTSQDKTALEIIHERKSVREFTGEAVDSSMLEQLVRAGMAAPSARNLQAWAFIIVADRESLDFMCEALPYAKMLEKAGAAIVVCGDTQKASTDVYEDYWALECSAASQNILLAAEALGLGAVWTAAFPYEDRMNPVRKVLDIPEHLIPLNVIPIGHPVGTEKPKDKWKTENLIWR